MKKPEHNTCHGCGLEAIDDCIAIEGKKHIPAVCEIEPCRSCIRNPRIKDHWNECWTIDSDGKPFIEK